MKNEMKVLGRRRPYSGGLEGSQGFFEMCIALRGDQPFIPRGLYRFKSYSDLNEWTLKMLARPKADRPR
jgi:hypothetical protein